MRSTINLFFASVITLSLLACGASQKEEKADLSDKKAQLEKLRKEQSNTSLEIQKLESEIATLDPEAANAAQAKLVVLDTIGQETFTHYIDLQGKVDAENISYITPRGMGGQVRAIYVKEGDAVKKGQLLLKLDDAILRQQVVTARQSMGATRAQLELARSLYQRQKNVWEQNIGTEVQVLQAKTQVEALENNLKTQQENVRAAEEQLRTTSVVSNVSGIAEEVNIHVGETFTGAPMQGIKIVNNSSLKVVTDIPENYLARVSKGTPVVITVPDINKTYNSTIFYVGQSINASSRGFTAEAKIPSDKNLKPNLTATIRIQDYKKANAVTVPVNTLQTDETGKFVYVAKKEGKNLVARKRSVQIGELYSGELEIKDGLQQGDVIVTEGFQNLYDGQLLTVSTAAP
ncbi:efflux RND transporter periplasmic adaptor subunit [Segetibacter sp. 3557_3]|uniref:efflux RND transporter periplasmic adaptor subunit n=1 Tax=Segetibacter sp. 3557_3 TaxID=2547429 RepID=UPI001058CEBD|nr:efflux RND transporter periplasmic adaptor subunit [Segetibacter sp. 3557_3]TDH26182.1 efflux RND transporter periplasmic adaptor subunit [Segetibacter sp. 3557_3]